MSLLSHRLQFPGDLGFSRMAGQAVVGSAVQVATVTTHCSLFSQILHHGIVPCGRREDFHILSMFAIVVIGMVAVDSVAFWTNQRLLATELALGHRIGHDGFPVGGSRAGRRRVWIVPRTLSQVWIILGLGEPSGFNVSRPSRRRVSVRRM
jgi:hypothetical protein